MGSGQIERKANAVSPSEWDISTPIWIDMNSGGELVSLCVLVGTGAAVRREPWGRLCPREMADDGGGVGGPSRVDAPVVAGNWVDGRLIRAHGPARKRGRDESGLTVFSRHETSPRRSPFARRWNAGPLCARRYSGRAHGATFAPRSISGEVCSKLAFVEGWGRTTRREWLVRQGFRGPTDPRFAIGTLPRKRFD